MVDFEEPQEESSGDDPYVFRQPAGYAAALDAPPQVVAPTAPRLAPIPELPPQEYTWNYRVSGRGIYDEPPSDEVISPNLGAPPPVPPPAPEFARPAVEPAPLVTSATWRAMALTFATVAVVEGGLIAYLLVG